MMFTGMGNVPDVGSAISAVGSRSTVQQMMARDIEQEQGKLDRRIADLRARERQYLAEFEQRMEQIRAYYQSVSEVLL